MDSSLGKSTSENNSLQISHSQVGIGFPVPVLKQEAGPAVAANVQIEANQEPTGIDNRLRAVFGKIVAQFGFYASAKTSFQFLRIASAAEDTNNRAAYLNVISQMWDIIQNCRQQISQQQTKRPRKKRLKTKESAGNTGALSSFTERDLLWIVKYAQFGSLITQLSKWETDNQCGWYLSAAKVADEYKLEWFYEKQIHLIRDKLKMYEQGLLTPRSFMKFGGLKVR